MIQVGDKILVVAHPGTGTWKAIVTGVERGSLSWRARWLRDNVTGSVRVAEEGESWVRGWDLDARSALKFMRATK